jgi:hypothetical protein
MYEVKHRSKAAVLFSVIEGADQTQTLSDLAL